MRGLFKIKIPFSVPTEAQIKRENSWAQQKQRKEHKENVLAIALPELAEPGV